MNTTIEPDRLLFIGSAYATPRHMHALYGQWRRLTERSNCTFMPTVNLPLVHWGHNGRACSCSLYVVVRPSVCRLSVTLVHLTQPIEIFGNVSPPFNTLVT